MFDSANLDLVTSSSSLVASQLLARIITPMTTEFLELVDTMDEEWTRVLLDRISQCDENTIPDTWVISPGYQGTPAFLESWKRGDTIYLHHLVREPTDRKQKLPCVPLLLQRDGESILLPEDKTIVQLHDRILCAGNNEAMIKMKRILGSREILHYTMTGQHLPASLFLSWLMSKQTATDSHH